MRGSHNEITLPYRRIVPVRPVEKLLVAGLSVGTAFFAVALIIDGPNLLLEELILLAGAYGLLSAYFVARRVQFATFKIFDIPVFITIIAFVQFGLAPVCALIYPSSTRAILRGGYTLELQALLYVMLGMAAFWFGSSCFGTPKNATDAALAENLAEQKASTNNSTLGWELAFYLVSSAANLYRLHEHLFYYAESFIKYHQHLAAAQVLSSISQFGTYALVLAAVERYFHPADSRRRVLFEVIFVSQCFWGLISGMKSLLLWNFLLVALISSLVRKKFRLGWILVAVSVLILIYPVSNQYRLLIRDEGVEISSTSSASRAFGTALSGAVSGQSGTDDWLDNGARYTIDRLDLLQSVSDIIWLGPRLTTVRTIENWWMLPFYPFVPRFLWPSKPVEDVGLEFGLALNGNVQTAAAITYPGDLYVELGSPGIVVGMFLLGVFGQWLTSKGDGMLDKKKSLFLYAALFPSVVNLEDDAFGFWTGVIKWLAILTIVAWAVYGPSRARRLVTRQ
jgi:hypothetical protein